MVYVSLYVFVVIKRKNAWAGSLQYGNSNGIIFRIAGG